jgi:sterol 3beta-glucosyltransferase
VKITINTFGTRGDIQPYIALGKGLQRAGYTVCIFSYQIFSSFVKEHGLDFYPLDLDPRQALIDQAISELGNNIFHIMSWLEKNFKPVLQAAFRTTLDANHDADLTLNSGLSFVGWHIAEKLKIPAMAAYLWPATPSRYIPPTLGYKPPNWLPFKEIINYGSTKLSNQTFFNLLRSSVNQCRKDILNLEPLTLKDYWHMDAAPSTPPILYGYSPAVLPKPPDWGEKQQVSGYWFLDTATGYQPDSNLIDFLAGGSPPIYFGFGSMVEHEQEELIQTVIKALEKTNQRGILLSGWSKLDFSDLPASILGIEAVPHDWLFQKIAAVVHHGGAGTTAVGLRAGVPSIVIPSFGDQFFWGERVYELGVGPKPIPRRKMTADKLANAIEQTLENDVFQKNVAQISQRIQAENGVETAIQIIERFARDWHK